MKTEIYLEVNTQVSLELDLSLLPRERTNNILGGNEDQGDDTEILNS